MVQNKKKDNEPLYDWSKFSLSDYEADEARLAELFYTLDSHKDGYVTVEELEQYLLNKGEMVERADIVAIIARGDIKKDGMLDYQEFMLFMLEHERNLWKHFVHLDRDGSGQISHSELLHYCQSNQLDIPESRLRELMTRLDKDGNLHISWEEFREFNQFKLRYKISSKHYYGSSYVDGIIEPPQSQDTAGFNATQKIVCGGIAGVVSRTLTAPCDRLKVLLQVQGQQRVLGASQDLKMGQMLRGMWGEGLFTMWRGNAVNCFKIFPENALRLALFEFLCNTGMFNNKFLNGSITGITIQTIMYPLEMTKTRIMTSTGRSTIRNAVKEIVGNPWKLSNFYIGLTPALCGVIPFAGLELGLSKTGTEMWNKYHNITYPGFWPLFTIASSATFVAMGVTYPARLMTCQMQAYTGPEEGRLSMWGHVTRICKAEGWRGLYRGFGANAVKAIPASAIGWTVFNMSQRYYDRLFTSNKFSYT